MFRFYVNKKNENKFSLSEETLKHIKIARVSNEKFICIFEGSFYITKLEKDKAVIIEKLEEFHDFDQDVIIAASIMNIKRFEWLIQKAAELGATKLIPIISKNISTKLPHDINKKIKRWNEIAVNASEQSFRNYPMIVENPLNFNDILNINIPNKYIAHEKENNNPSDTLPTNSIFLVGPEGGFTNEEVILAKKNNFNVVSLGKRILRAETASLFILSRVK